MSLERIAARMRCRAGLSSDPPDQAPALVGLALHVSSPRLALRVERVEVLLEAVLGRHTGVDGAAQRLGARFDHRPEPFWSRRPKKRGPFQRVPVIARATLERLG